MDSEPLLELEQDPPMFLHRGCDFPFPCCRRAGEQQFGICLGRPFQPCLAGAELPPPPDALQATWHQAPPSQTMPKLTSCIWPEAPVREGGATFHCPDDRVGPSPMAHDIDHQAEQPLGCNRSLAVEETSTGKGLSAREDLSEAVKFSPAHPAPASGGSCVSQAIHGSFDPFHLIGIPFPHWLGRNEQCLSTRQQLLRHQLVSQAKSAICCLAVVRNWWSLGDPTFARPLA